ncbi:MAG: C39 family peptidase [Armatimonadota bacterium]
MIPIFSLVSAVPTSVETILKVPFLEQLWDDDKRGHGSCGPASIAMCCRYVLGLNSPSIQDIVNVWRYLGGDPDGNDMNGTSLSQLVDSCHDCFKINSVHGSEMDVDSVKGEIAEGRPVVLHVLCEHLTNRGYPYKAGHWIAAVGFNDDYVICNDPGTCRGFNKYYSNYDITRAMADRSNEVICGFYR